MSVSLTLEDEIDISRGDMIVKQNNPPESSQQIEAMLVWFSSDANWSSAVAIPFGTRPMRPSAC